MAVLGLANPASGLWVDLPEGLKFSAPLEAAQTWVPRIMAQEAPDRLVVLLHSGKRPERDREGALMAGFAASQGAVALARALPQIDLILTGHDHWLYPRGPRPHQIGGVALAGPGSRGRALLELNLTGRAWKAKIHWAEARREEPPWPKGFVAWARELLPVNLAFSGAKRQKACFEALAAASLRSPKRFGSALPQVYLRRGLRVSVLDRSALYELFEHDDRPQDVLLSRRDLSLLADPEAPPGRRHPPYSRQVNLDLSQPLELSRDWLWPSAEALERKYTIALSGYHLRGGGAVVPKLFLDPQPGPAGLPLRESVFKYLKARKPLPEACDMLSYVPAGT